MGEEGGGDVEVADAGCGSRRSDDRCERGRHLVALVVLGTHLLAKNDHWSSSRLIGANGALLTRASRPGKSLVACPGLRRDRRCPVDRNATRASDQGKSRARSQTDDGSL